MKYVILLLAVLAGIWWIRKQRPQNTGTQTSRPPSGPQTMVTCAQCGVHLPDCDAVHGLQGVYCSVAHRQQVET
jgi:uncharacterized protein